MKRRTIPTVTLAGGIRMPQIGCGLFQLKDYEVCAKCVKEALGLGYRLFDTASAYFNENAVGDVISEAVSEGRIRREDVFLTTKVWLQDYGEKETEDSVRRSLKLLQTDYLDLVLLHQPFGNWQEAWRTLEHLRRQGVVCAIGTSNFTPRKMKELLAFAAEIPQINQIEIHPFYTETVYAAHLRELHIQPEAWGPLNEGQRHIFTNPVLARIGARYGKSAAQTALRWSIQQGTVVIPRSTKPEHLAENLDVLDFVLTPEEMKEVESLDLGHSEIADFESPATERLLMKLRIHS